MTRIEIPHDSDSIHAVLIDRVNQHSRIIEDHRHAIEELQDVTRQQNETLERIEHSLSKIADVFSAGEGTMHVAKWLGKLVVWICGIVSGLYGLYFAITNWPNKGG